MKFILFSISACCLMALGSVAAEERSAAGALDTQINWTSLKKQVDHTNAKTLAAGTRIDQVAVCGALGMVYAPGASGANSSGCIAAAAKPITINTINNLNEIITNNATNLNNLQTVVNNMVNCGQGKQFFNGSTCVSNPPAGSPFGCRMQASNHSTTCSYSSPKISCPTPGSVIVGFKTDDCGHEGNKSTSSYTCMWVECN